MQVPLERACPFNCACFWIRRDLSSRICQSSMFNKAWLFLRRDDRLDAEKHTGIVAFTVNFDPEPGDLISAD